MPIIPTAIETKPADATNETPKAPVEKPKIVKIAIGSQKQKGKSPPKKVEKPKTKVVDQEAKPDPKSRPRVQTVTISKAPEPKPAPKQTEPDKKPVDDPM